MQYNTVYYTYCVLSIRIIHNTRPTPVHCATLRLVCSIAAKQRGTEIFNRALKMAAQATGLCDASREDDLR